MVKNSRLVSTVIFYREFPRTIVYIMNLLCGLLLEDDGHIAPCNPDGLYVYMYIYACIHVSMYIFICSISKSEGDVLVCVVFTLRTYIYIKAYIHN